MTSNQPATPTATSTTPLVLTVIAILALAAVVAVFAGGSDDGPGFDLASIEAPTIVGTPLEEGQTGVPAPAVDGPALLSEGGQVVPVEGEGTMIVFLAHWCEYCNAEVPVVNEWLATHGLPEGTEVVAVATAIDETRAHFPPTTWLRERDWTVPTLVDTDGSIADAYAVPSYPYWVFVDAAGTVVGASGPMMVDGLAAVAAQLAAP